LTQFLLNFRAIPVTLKKSDVAACYRLRFGLVVLFYHQLRQLSRKKSEVFMTIRYWTNFDGYTVNHQNGDFCSHNVSRKVKNLFKILHTLQASLNCSFNTHQALRLIEFAQELSRCRIDQNVKNFWAIQANAAAYKLSSQ
jgi:hypothetical protein